MFNIMEGGENVTMRRALLVPLIVILLVVAYLPGCTIFKPENRAPVAVFSANPNSINAGETVYFSANESKDKDGKIVKYSWSFGDDTYSLEKWTSHTYGKGGNFTVELIVKDDGGAVDRSNTTVHVNAWPFAEGRAGKDPAKVNDVIQFDGSMSSDRDGKITEFVWDFGDGSQTIKGMAPSHKFTKVGTYNVNLTVTDNDKASAKYDFKIRIIKRNFKVLWQEDSRVLTTISDWSSKNTTMNKTYKVTMNNMTSLVFNMTWKDLIPIIGQPNDDFTLNTSSPSGDKKRSETTTQVLVEKFRIDEVPDTINMEADTMDAVRASMSNKYTSQKGIGDWLMGISLAPTDTGGIFNMTELADLGNDWQIEITAYYYQANIIEVG